MSDIEISRRGVYYDLEKSPYEYRTPYGDSFKFSSEKKLQMYTRQITAEMSRIHKVFDKHKLLNYLSDSAHEAIISAIYRSYYDSFEVKHGKK